MRVRLNLNNRALILVMKARRRRHKMNAATNDITAVLKTATSAHCATDIISDAFSTLSAKKKRKSSMKQSAARFA